MDEQSNTSRASWAFNFLRRHWLGVLIVMLLVCIAIGFYLGRASVYMANPGLAGAEQASAMLANVGKLIELPTDETPTVATISDAASAKQGQPFLVNAQNGDALIVYQQAGEAILYRPSTNKLIAVGPVYNNSDVQNQPASVPSTASTSTITNATTTKPKK